MFTNDPVMQTDVSNLTGTSNASVLKGTGKTWEEWVKFLDVRHAAGHSHKEIVEILTEYIDSSWWCQSVANGYEKIKGKRIPGQTS